MVSVVICVATDLEGSLLQQSAFNRSGMRILRTGVGPVNAAHAVTLAIAAEKPDSIVVCGVGGAYPASGLEVGEIVCASMECYGDLGADSPTGFLDMKALGFPVIDSSPPLFNDLPLQVFPVERRVKFVTVSTCTGTLASARAIESRTGGAVENMEGAAIAHVAHLHGIPVGELRSISNVVTNRDKGTWKLRDAAAAAQRALIEWLGH